MPDKKPSTEIWDELRKPFAKEAIGQLTKGGAKLDYVGHAAVTDRLNMVVGPEHWNWEPLALTEEGMPRIDRSGNLWIKLTINGVTKLGVGDGKSAKELIGDALRNAAMRFGVALDLWSKEELESNIANPENKNEKPSAAANAAPVPPPDEPEPFGAIQYATKTQRTQIAFYLRGQGVDRDDMLEVLRSKYHVEVPDRMTFDEAERVLGFMTAKAAMDRTDDQLKQEQNV